MSLCPICFDAAGALTDGARAGALVLALVAGVVVASFARFGWRILRISPESQALSSAGGADPRLSAAEAAETTADTAGNNR